MSLHRLTEVVSGHSRATEEHDLRHDDSIGLAPQSSMERKPCVLPIFIVASFGSLNLRPLGQKITGTGMDHQTPPRSGAFHSSHLLSVRLYLTFELSQGPEEKGKENENRERGDKEQADE